MQLPENPTLPLFAYGALQPGEVSFFRIRAFVEASRSCSVRGSTLVRDGLLIADEAGNSRVNGHLLSFHAEKCEAAYRAICDLEPSKQYRWGTVQIEGSMANILWGKSPRKGSVELDFDWSSWDDPLFTTALEVVQGQLDQFSRWEWDYKNTFHLQMAYLLLWTSIERYASLRYHLKRDATEKVNRVASEAAFSERLRALVLEKRSIQRADDPGEKIELDPAVPLNAMEYYYQVRSNMVHRGKGMPRDHDIVLSSCRELLQIFRHVLDVAKSEAGAEA